MSMEASQDFDPTPAEELRGDIALDRFHLEVEAARQSTLFDKYASRSAELRLKRDNLKVKIKVRTGEIAKDYRIMGIPGGIKVTQDSMEEALGRHEELVQMAYELAELDRDLNLAEGVVSAMEQKKSMISSLVQLAVSSYYQTSTTQNQENPANQARRALNKKD